ncbi:MAG: UTP--glucose-1-phosphate uridylyltransferase [Polyangiaceae bacterium]
MSLDDDLATLPSQLRARIDERGFRVDRLAAWASTIGKGRDARNRLTGRVEPPADGDVVSLPAEGSAEHETLRKTGVELLAAGHVALCVLAGGMATRMGGVVKALVEALPGKTFLELRLAEQRAVERLAGRKPPLWLMTSEATRGPIEAALGSKNDGEHLAVFEQCVALRLDPDGRLFREADAPADDPDHGYSVYATGHGDLPEALGKSGLLQRFLDKNKGEGFVYLANLDNLGATLDPAIIGWHAERCRAGGAKLMVEVVDKVGSDRGGVPVRWNGRRIIAEEFRLPLELDPATIRVFNTNTFLVEAASLASAEHFDFTFVEVEKKVAGRTAIQFERLLGEITVPLEPSFLRVPREGTSSRFLPVKDNDELARRRPEIEAVARARGFFE